MKTQSHADCCFAVDPAEFRENVTITAFFFFFFLTILLLFSFSPEGRKALTSPSLSWVEDMLDVLLIFTSLLTSELMWIDLYSQSLLVKNTGPPCITLHHIRRVSYVGYACTRMWSSSVVIIFSILLLLFGGAWRAAGGARSSNPHGHSMCEGSFNWKSVRSSSWSEETDKANCCGN